MEILKPILITFLTAAASGAASVLTACVASWIKNKIKNEKVANMLIDINNIVMDAVKAVYQSFVQTLKDNDKFDANAQAEAKNKAMTIIRRDLSEDLTNYIQSTFGDVETYIGNQIESALYSLKN